MIQYPGVAPFIGPIDGDFPTDIWRNAFFTAVSFPCSLLSFAGSARASLIGLLLFNVFMLNPVILIIKPISSGPQTLQDVISFALTGQSDCAGKSLDSSSDFRKSVKAGRQSAAQNTVDPALRCLLLRLSGRRVCCEQLILDPQSFGQQAYHFGYVDGPSRTH